MKTFIGLIAASIILSVTLAWLFRYETLWAQGFVTLKFDRWTGETSVTLPQDALYTLDQEVFVTVPLPTTQK